MAFIGDRSCQFQVNNYGSSFKLILEARRRRFKQASSDFVLPKIKKGLFTFVPDVDRFFLFQFFPDVDRFFPITKSPLSLTDVNRC